MTTLVATTGRATAATVASGLILLLRSLLLVRIGETRSSRGRGRRGTHAKARESGLIAPMRVLWRLLLRLLRLRLLLLLLLLLRGIYWYT